jgi:hypothetical protein
MVWNAWQMIKRIFFPEPEGKSYRAAQNTRWELNIDLKKDQMKS